MQKLIDYRYQIINPLLINLIQQEIQFFGTCYSAINNVGNKISVLQTPISTDITNKYDPLKYTRGRKLLSGVDTSSLPEVKMKEKYTYEDYKNYRNIMNLNNNQGGYDTNKNNIEVKEKKYSFADYVSKKSSGNINNNIGCVGISSNSDNINNNNIEEQKKESSNPYSYEAYKKRTQSLGASNRRVNNYNSQRESNNKNVHINPYFAGANIGSFPTKNFSNNNNNMFEEPNPKNPFENNEFSSANNPYSNSNPYYNFNNGSNNNQSNNNSNNNKNSYNFGFGS